MVDVPMQNSLATWDNLLTYRLGCGVYQAICLILSNISYLLAIACYISNTFNETAIVAWYFSIISGVAKWHAVLFEGELLIKITTVSMLFVFE